MSDVEEDEFEQFENKQSQKLGQKLNEIIHIFTSFPCVNYSKEDNKIEKSNLNSLLYQLSLTCNLKEKLKIVIKEEDKVKRKSILDKLNQEKILRLRKYKLMSCFGQENIKVYKGIYNYKIIENILNQNIVQVMINNIFSKYKSINIKSMKEYKKKSVEIYKKHEIFTDFLKEKIDIVSNYIIKNGIIKNTPKISKLTKEYKIKLKRESVFANSFEDDYIKIVDRLKREKKEGKKVSLKEKKDLEDRLQKVNCKEFKIKNIEKKGKVYSIEVNRELKKQKFI